MNQERSKHDGQPALGLTGAQERGRAAHQSWIADGTLITAVDYAARRGLAEHEVAALETRGGLFSVAIDGVPWYPAELLRLSPDAATALCQAIRPLDEVSKLVFVMRTHGALGGLTVTEAALRGQWERTLTLAKTWSNE